MVANAPEPEVLERLIGFGRDLRRRGLPVGTGRIVTFCRAAGALGLVERDDVYWAGRSSLISRPEDVEAFDEAFAAWFGTGFRLRLPMPGSPPDVDATREDERALEGDSLDDRVLAREWHELEEDALTDGEASIRIVASAAEMLREKSFGDLTEEERVRVTRLIRKLALQLPMQHTRRYRASPSGPRFDVRRTLRRSLRTQGEPFHRAWRERGRRTRPLVLILDISGSMAPYSRALMQFAFAAMAAGRRVEVFCFGTRLTRVTRTLRTKDPDRALREIGHLVEDWEGGTRIGASLKEYNDVWGRRALTRGAIVLIASDGWERDDHELVGREMERLHRAAYAVVWVNPVKGSPDYQPLAAGMRAALPSIDRFVAGHNLASLEALAGLLTRIERRHGR